MNIRGVLARVFVDDLEAAIPFYESLAGSEDTHRFRFRTVELARVGPFLLLCGGAGRYRDRVATVHVGSLVPILTALRSSQGTIVEGPGPGPNGDRLIARHPDGSIFEYIEVGEK